MMWILINLVLCVILLGTGFINEAHGQITAHVEFTVTDNEQDVTLPCPLPDSHGDDVSWYRISKDDYTKERLQRYGFYSEKIVKYTTTTSGPKLVIRNVSAREAGEYLCVCSQKLREFGNGNITKISARILLTVLESNEEWDSLVVSSLSGKDITIYAMKCYQEYIGDLTCGRQITSDTKYVVGDAIMLFCNIPGRPARYEWTKQDNGIVTPIGDKNNHVLIATKAGYEAYVCNATIYLSDHTSVSTKKSILLRFHDKDDDIDSGTVALITIGAFVLLFVACLVMIMLYTALELGTILTVIGQDSVRRRWKPHSNARNALGTN